jgi:monomeric isocitrate dehydrogenase
VTHAIPQQDEIKELKETLKAMAEQIKNRTALIAQQMNPTQNQAGYGGYYQQPQSITAQPQMPPQYR